METKTVGVVDVNAAKQIVARQSLLMLAALEKGDAFEAMNASLNLSAHLIAGVAATRPDDKVEWVTAVVEVLQLRISTETFALGMPATPTETEGQ